MIILLLLSISCKKDPILEGNKEANSPLSTRTNTSGFYQLNGRLIFGDSVALENFSNWLYLNMNNDEAIENFYKEIGFTSLYSKYNEVMNSENQETLNFALKNYKNCFVERYIDNDVFYDLPLSFVSSNIANTDGVYQIGSSIVRETALTKRVIKNGDESLMPLLLSDEPMGANEDIYTALRSSICPPKKLDYSYRTVYFTNSRRLVTRMGWDTPPYVSYEYSVKTSSQKRIAGTWWQNRISKIGIKREQGEYYMETSTNPNPIGSFSDEGSNKAVIWASVHSMLRINFIPSYCKYESWGVRDGVRKEIKNLEQFPDSW